MLSGAYCHRLGRDDVDKRRLPRVGIWHPYRYGKPVRVATEWNRQCPSDVQQKGAGAIGKGWTTDVSRGSRRGGEDDLDGTVDVCSRRQGRVSIERAGYIVVGTVHIVIFLYKARIRFC